MNMVTLEPSLIFSPIIHPQLLYFIDNIFHFTIRAQYFNLVSSNFLSCTQI